MHSCSKQGHCESDPTLQQVAQRDVEPPSVERVKT